MHKRKLGAFEVSSIGLGCMNMSMGYGPADDRESIRLLHEALECGYTFLDTASMYGFGHNEELIGKALSHRRQEYVLASKCGIYPDGDRKTRLDGRPEVLKQTCEGSLRRLNTDCIDLYYLHRIDPKIPLEDSVGALSEMVHQGKIRAIGLSETSVVSLRKAHAVHPISAMQSEYSLWSRTPERQMLAACLDLGVTFIPFSPLGRAFLTGKATDVTQLAVGDIRTTIARPRFEPENFAHNNKLLLPFSDIATELGWSMAQLALAWLLAQADSSLIPIPGTKHREFMAENAAAGDLELDQAIVSSLDRLINESTVAGRRYTDAGMAAADSEKD